MLIILKQFEPFANPVDLKNECINECIILVVCYMMILASNFDPLENRPLREINGYFLIFVICGTAAYFLCVIVKNVILGMVREYRKKRVAHKKKALLKEKVSLYLSKKDTQVKIDRKIRKY